MEIDKLAFIFIKDKQLLVTISKGKDVFYIPGGKRENSENNMQALIREVKEELTVDLIPKTIKFYGIFRARAHGKPEGTTVKMTCYTGNFVGKLEPSSEIEKIVWVSSKDIKIAPPVDKLILENLKSKKLIE
ncbi:MAG: NUDIX domain-containing protein [Candidatus Aenigmarchaeota archaeon]|nr:NUDIX domain-containing protein [Candidatus Aenigmarchaeota archaeon]